MVCRWSAVLAGALILGACTVQDTKPTPEAGAPAEARTLSARVLPQLVVAGFNVESGGADLQTLADRVSSFPEVNAWGFSEVESSKWTQTFAAAAAKSGRTFHAVTGTTGGADRLAVLLDTSALTYLGHKELTQEMVAACGKKTARAPLLVEAETKAGGRRILFMVNHLQRGDAAYRACQARFLNGWARSSTEPLIAVGDYNFDWNLPNGEADHDQGYDRLTADGVFQWVRPASLIKTNCDPKYNSVLDFVFAAGPARQWPAESAIGLTEPEYCFKEVQGRESDHRPVLARFGIPAQ